MQIILNDIVVNETYLAYESHSLYQMLQLIHFLNKYYLPVLIFVGIPLNIWIIRLSKSLKQKQKEVPTKVYMTGIALSDIVFLVLLFGKWIKYLPDGYDILTRGVFCQVVTCVAGLSLFTSTWLTLFMLAERYINVCLPRFRKLICTVLKARIIVTVIVLTGVVLFLNLSVLFQEYRFDDGSSLCVPYKYMDVIRITDYVYLVVNVLLPYSLMMLLIVCGIIAFYFDKKASTVSISKLNCDVMTMSNEGTVMLERDYLKDSEVKWDLLRMSIVNASMFIIFTIVSFLISFYILVGHFDHTTFFVQELLHFLLYSRFAFNFVWYVISSKCFRKCIIQSVKIFFEKSEKDRRSIHFALIESQTSDAK